MQNSNKMLKEACRVLTDDGVLIMVTYGHPEFRENLLIKDEYNWILKRHYKIYKANINPAGQIFDIKDLDNYHYIYICKKVTRKFCFYLSG